MTAATALAQIGTAKPLTTTVQPRKTRASCSRESKARTTIASEVNGFMAVLLQGLTEKALA